MKVVVFPLCSIIMGLISVVFVVIALNFQNYWLMLCKNVITSFCIFVLLKCQPNLIFSKLLTFHFFHILIWNIFEMLNSWLSLWLNFWWRVIVIFGKISSYFTKFGIQPLVFLDQVLVTLRMGNFLGHDLINIYKTMQICSFSVSPWPR